MGHSGTVVGVPAHGGTWVGSEILPSPRAVAAGPVWALGQSQPFPRLQLQFPAGSTTSPCVWNACGARKAPLGALDSSSSGSSDSDDDDDDNKAKAATEPTAQEPGKDRAAPSR